jgi:hypothetical protein
VRTRAIAAAFALLIVMAAVAILLGAPPIVSLLAVLAGLGGYDLLLFQKRMAAHDPADRPALQRDHLRMLGVTLSIGLLLGGGALIIRTTPGFAGLLALALLAVGLLAALMRRIREHRGDIQP